MPSWLLLVGLVVGVAGGTAAVQAWIRHRFPGLRRGEQNEVATFLFPVVFGSERALIHYGAVSVLVAANLFLVTELSYPFLGEFPTSPEPLRDVIQVLSSPR
ncbi:hypothetical protein [Streptomyces sirii]|uniref:hypothetical protein n=1 Tax=Streptomyces sirii TaxID=3127701 RepID=UPI003D36D5DE